MSEGKHTELLPLRIEEDRWGDWKITTDYGEEANLAAGRACDEEIELFSLESIAVGMSGEEVAAVAAFIVKAANSHDQLVEALRDSKQMLGFLCSIIRAGEYFNEDDEARYDAMLNKINDALAEAEEPTP